MSPNWWKCVELRLGVMSVIFSKDELIQLVHFCHPRSIKWPLVWPLARWWPADLTPRRISRVKIMAHAVVIETNHVDSVCISLS